jgi:hypothetical protein
VTKKHILAVVAALIPTVGCTPRTPIRWSKTGGSYDAYLEDRYACIQGARTTVSAVYLDPTYGGGGGSHEVISPGIFRACMSARGYVEDPSGAFGPPPIPGHH